MTDNVIELDVFKDHVAKYEKHGDQLETLEWKNPNSTTMAIWYVRQHGSLMVFGDCYDAIYQWSWHQNITLEWMSKLREDYFISKCQASPHGREPKVFDSDALEKRMKEYFADGCTMREPRCPKGECECCDLRRKEEHLFSQDEYNGWGHMEDEFTWVAWLRENGDAVFGADWWESVPTGMILGPCIHLHLKGLRDAFEYLAKEKP